MVLELERECSIPPDSDLVVKLSLLVERLQQEHPGKGRMLRMSPHRTAHLLSELECRSERVKNSETVVPVTICYIPGRVRAAMHELKEKGDWWWSEEKNGTNPTGSGAPSVMDAWEVRLQRLRIRLRREPTQDEMLAEWNGLATRGWTGATNVSSGMPEDTA